MVKKIILALALLFLIGTASALTLTGDFSLETNCAIPDKAMYTLHNDSGTTKTYTISAIGENNDWININGVWIGETPLVITLTDGDSEELYAFVKPKSCYVTPGEYTIVIDVSGEKKEIIVIVVESRLLELDITPESQGISQCEKAEFDIRVKNTGEMNETVSLEVEGLPNGWTKLGFSEMFLEEGKTKTVTLEIQPECDSETKEYEFSIKAGLKGTAFFTVENASFEIEDEQGISITATEMDACKEKIMQETVKVKNNGLLEDELHLSVAGIDWATVEPKDLTLKAGEEKEVSIIFARTNAAEGTYDFDFLAHSAKFNKGTSKEISAELQDCYNISITDTKIDGAGEAKACIGEKTLYEITLENDGLQPIEAEIAIFGIDAIVSQGAVEIASGKTATIEVEIDLAGEQVGEKVFTLQVKSENFSMQRDYSFIAENCYGLNVDWDGLNEEIELDANCKSEPFTVKALNTGTKSQNVVVSVSGPEWIYFEPEQTGIEAGAEQEIYFYMAPPYDTKEGKHTATVTIRGKNQTFRKELALVVYGGLYAELGTASVETDAEVIEILERTERSIKVSVQVSNDGNSMIRISNISSQDFNAGFEFEEILLNPAESIKVPMTLYIGESEEREFDLVLKIETDKGTMEREITVDLDKKPEEQDIFVGLFGLGDASDLALAGIVIAVIIAFAAIALKAEAKEKPKGGLTNLTKDVQDLPGKKLEEIGKHRKNNSATGLKQGKKAGNKNNLHDIVKEVKKKHPVKKTSKKRVALKKKK